MATSHAQDELTISYRKFKLKRFLTLSNSSLITQLTAYLWAVILILPGTSINPNKEIWQYMSLVGSDTIWSGIFLITGLLQTWRTFDSRPQFYYDLIVKFIVCGVWTYVAVATFCSRFPPPLLATDTLVVSILCWRDFIKQNLHL